MTEIDQYIEISLKIIFGPVQGFWKDQSQKFQKNFTTCQIVFINFTEIYVLHLIFTGNPVVHLPQR